MKIGGKAIPIPGLEQTINKVARGARPKAKTSPWLNILHTKHIYSQNISLARYFTKNTHL